MNNVSQSDNLPQDLPQVIQQQQLVLETIAEGVSHVVHRRIRWANSSLDSMLGYGRGETVGMDAAEFYLTSEDHLRVGRESAAELSQGHPYSIEVMLRKKDGSPIWTNMVGKAIDPENVDDGVIWIIHDITERKQSQIRLAESEARFRKTVEISPIPMALNDEQGKITYLNPAFVKTFGYDHRDMPTLADWWPLAYPDAQYREYVISTWAKRIADAKKDGKFFEELELKIHCRDGSDRFVIAGAASLTGRFEGDHLVTLFDITERILSEEALYEEGIRLQKSELRFRQAIDTSPVPMILTDSSREILFLNPSFTATFGYTIQDIPTVAEWRLRAFPDPVYREFIIRRRRHKVNAQFGAQISSGPLEARIKCKSGDERIVMVTSTTMFEGGENLELITAIDITERKKAEMGLVESEGRFREVLENSLDIVYKHDLESDLHVYVSPAVFRILGYTEEEVRTMRMEAILGLVHPDDRVEVGNRISFALSNPEQARQELQYRLRHKNGSYVWLSDALSIIRDDQQKPQAIIGSLRDITLQKQAEQQRERLEFQNRQLQRAESLGRMAGSIAHHFNNRLQSVLMSLEFALQIRSSDRELADVLHVAWEEAVKASQVSTQMLTYMGLSHQRKTPLDIDSACRQGMELLRITLPRQVSLVCLFSEKPAIVSADPSLIHQILTILMTNAWEALGAQNGKISLDLKTVTAEEIQPAHRFPALWSPALDSYACIQVSDTGFGIPADKLDLIFDPFYTTKSTGRGMGLSVLQGIVQSLQGGITVQSEPGRGSTFSVYLPLIAEKRKEKSKAPPPAMDLPADGTLLIVDDEPSVLKTTEMLLRRLGFIVLTAIDGVEALKVFHQNLGTIDLVICDLSMPNMDGWQTMEALHESAPGLPIILASGHNEAFAMHEAGVLPPAAYLTKPFSLAVLRDTVQRVLFENKKN
jgi:two-component system, cell cycle sensor histidine kinase and response regulator CckA